MHFQILSILNPSVWQRRINPLHFSQAQSASHKLCLNWKDTFPSSAVRWLTTVNKHNIMSQSQRGHRDVHTEICTQRSAPVTNLPWKHQMQHTCASPMVKWGCHRANILAAPCCICRSVNCFIKGWFAIDCSLGCQGPFSKSSLHYYAFNKNLKVLPCGHLPVTNTDVHWSIKIEVIWS